MNTYTSEDAKLLINFWKAEFGEELISVIMCQVLKGDERFVGSLEETLERYPEDALHCMCKGLFQEVSEATEIIFNTNLEEIPLFINHDHKYVRVIAKWRLALGR
jgi:hypothetical protein